MNYFDILLAKKLRGGGGGDITIKSLNVTQNGTYSEEGVAYSPVKVNVPLPENAYLLKDIPNTPTSIATFSDGSDLPMPKLEVGIEPQQEGSGDPSPTNIRPISGWDEVNVGVSGVNLFDKATIKDGYVNDTTGAVSTGAGAKCTDFIRVLPNTSYYIKSEQTSGMWGAYYDENKNYVSGVTSYSNSVITTPSKAKYVRLTVFYNNSGNIDTFGINYPSTDTSYHAYNGQTYTIDLDGTRYGGKVDLVSGVMTVTHSSIKLNDLTWSRGSTPNNNWRFASNVINNIRIPSSVASVVGAKCSIYKEITANESWGAEKTGFAINVDGKLFICDLNIADTTELASVIANQTVVYELATPLTIQLSPTVVKSLRGVNNISADSGDVLSGKYFAEL